MKGTLYHECTCTTCEHSCVRDSLHKRLRPPEPMVSCASRCTNVQLGNSVGMLHAIMAITKFYHSKLVLMLVLMH